MSGTDLLRISIKYVKKLMGHMQISPLKYDTPANWALLWMVVFQNRNYGINFN
jgi:hypothetical protein